MGGNGIGLSTSGSGGVVVLDGGFKAPFKQIAVNGGLHRKNDKVSGFCANGGAGTIF